MGKYRQWHRWFGASWRDFVTGQPVQVEVELDLSLKLQLLDVALIRLEGELTIEMPDGFDDFGAHNLVSFKSFWEPMSGWSLTELLGYYSNYRKQASEGLDDLLPESEFRLYAVAARYPQGLRARTALERISEGVYQAEHFSGTLRLIVLGQLPMVPRNAVLLRFSADPARIEYAGQNYVPRSPDGSSLLGELFQGYLSEGVKMPYTIEQQREDSKRWALKHATVAELLEGVPLEKRLEGLSPEERAEMLRLLQQRPSNEGS